MTETFAAKSNRPLVLAEHIRGGASALKVRSAGDVVDAGKIPVGLFGGATPIVLDAVSDWLDAQDGGPTKWPDDRLQPNYRLPWPRVWVEWRDRWAERQTTQFGVVHRGMWVSEYALNGRSMREVYRDMFGPNVPNFMPMQTPEGATHVLFVQPVSWGSSTPAVLLTPPFLVLSTELGAGVGNHLSAHPKGSSYIPLTNDKLLAEDAWNEFGVWRLFTAWLTVKNITIGEVDLDRGSRRRAERQAIADGGPPPWVKYKTLAISLPSSPQGDGSVSHGGPASPVPFHLVRGHLSDYRNGKGLFGKWRSVVWIPTHTRGFQKAGAISKSYEALTPTFANNA